MKFGDDRSKRERVNSDIGQFGAILDNVGTKTTPAEVEVWIMYTFHSMSTIVYYI